MQKKLTSDERIARLESAFVEIHDVVNRMDAKLNRLIAESTEARKPSWESTFGPRYYAIRETLDKELPYEAVKYILYGKDTRIPYVSGYYVYTALNRIFGPDNWSYDADVKRIGGGLYFAWVTLTIAGVSRSNGSVNKQAKSNAPEQLAAKSAITNAFKRVASNFGRVLGGSLYSSQYVAKFNTWKNDRKNITDEDYALDLVYKWSHDNTIDEMQKKQDVEVTRIATAADDRMGIEDSITNWKAPKEKLRDAILLNDDKVKVSALIEDDATPFENPIEGSTVFPAKRLQPDTNDEDDKPTIRASSIIQGNAQKKSEEIFGVDLDELLSL